MTIMLSDEEVQTLLSLSRWVSIVFWSAVVIGLIGTLRWAWRSASHRGKWFIVGIGLGLAMIVIGWSLLYFEIGRIG